MPKNIDRSIARFMRTSFPFCEFMLCGLVLFLLIAAPVLDRWNGDLPQPLDRE